MEKKDNSTTAAPRVRDAYSLGRSISAIRLWAIRSQWPDFTPGLVSSCGTCGSSGLQCPSRSAGQTTLHELLRVFHE
ncbi:hypothetical protein PoB_006200600 [Plakobranchus ocellatus]|uniref:Uncharacterized protein n=1 Tax=Plakobranchus ocellatus TaxID=259542 RepID=A0AAV4CUA5_9GAST|nr:hypothetical protein PoB_006200600 [Plakobranchus ocellatus]